MKKNVSVIIRCFNSSEYLLDFLNSLIAQNIKMELIAINDGSCDNCEDILKRFKKAHLGFTMKIISSEETKGMAYSFKKGFEEATGEYISFLLPEDTIPLNYYEEMFANVKDEDLIIADIRALSYVTKRNNKIIFTQDAKGEYFDNQYACTIYNKIIRKSLINKKLIIDNDYYFADNLVLDIYNKAKKIKHTSKTRYLYNIDVYNRNSLSSVYLTNCETFLKSIKKIKKEDREKLLYRVFIEPYWNLFLGIEERKIRLSYLRKYYQMLNEYSLAENSYVFSKLTNYQGFFDEKIKKSLLQALTKKSARKTNTIITIYLYIHNILWTNVIDKNITVDEIIVKAQKNKYLESTHTISAVLLNYNGEKYLYDSLYSILGQTIKINELIIVDNGSNDNSANLIKDVVYYLEDYLPVKIINNKHQDSRLNNVRKSFKEATMDYVWLYDVHDLCHETFLKNLFANNKENVDIMFSNAAIINEDNYIVNKTIENYIDSDLTMRFSRNFIALGIELKDYFKRPRVFSLTSCLFRNDDYEQFFKKDISDELVTWYLFTIVALKGKISYKVSPLVYLRDPLYIPKDEDNRIINEIIEK